MMILHLGTIGLQTDVCDFCCLSEAFVICQDAPDVLVANHQLDYEHA